LPTGQLVKKLPAVWGARERRSGRKGTRALIHGQEPSFGSSRKPWFGNLGTYRFKIRDSFFKYRQQVGGRWKNNRTERAQRHLAPNCQPTSSCTSADNGESLRGGSGKAKRKKGSSKGRVCLLTGDNLNSAIISRGGGNTHDRRQTP